MRTRFCSRIASLVRFAAAGCLLGGALGQAGPVAAHPPLTDYVEHRITVQIDRSDIDIHVELTFHDMRSLLERRRMDADRNGLLTREEIGDYLSIRSGDLEDGLLLRLAGRPLPLALLYDPELDLGGNAGALGTRHTVRLTFFGRTPEPLPPGELRLENRLWPAAAASCSLEVRRSSAAFLRVTTPQTLWLPAPAGASRVLTISIHPAPADAPAIPFLHHLETPHAITTRPGLMPDVQRVHPASRPAG